MKVVSSDSQLRHGAQVCPVNGALRLPTVLRREGGYLSDALDGNLRSFLSGFRTARGA